MARRLSLHYFPGSSVLHGWDPRCKLAGLVLVTAIAAHDRAAVFAFLSILLAVLVLVARLPGRRLLKELRGWMILVVMIFLAQALFSPGERLPHLAWLPVSREGISTAALSCWRLALILGYAVIFTAVTRPRELRETIRWFLRPMPGLSSRRVALMVTLALNSLVVLFDAVEHVKLANRARFAHLPRNPVRRMRALALPVLRKSLARVDDLTLALQARGYREDLPTLLPRLPLGHCLPLPTLVVAVLLVQGMFR